MTEITRQGVSPKMADLDHIREVREAARRYQQETIHEEPSNKDEDILSDSEKEAIQEKIVAITDVP